MKKACALLICSIIGTVCLCYWLFRTSSNTPSDQVSDGLRESLWAKTNTPVSNLLTTVVIESTSNPPVQIEGEIIHPGAYEYSRGLTVLTAIQLAGGFNSQGSRKVVLVREYGQRFVVNCDRAMKDSGLDLLVFPGDIRDDW